MRILIATGIYPPSIGGPATYSKILFQELPKRGISVRVLSFDEVRHLPKVIRHFSYFLKAIYYALGCDIIYAQDPVSVGLPSLFAAKILRKRFFLKIVGDYAWEQGVQRFGVADLLDIFSKKRRGHYRIFIRILIRLEEIVARQADKIITPSNYLANILRLWGVNQNKISVIGNAFEQVSDEMVQGNSLMDSRDKNIVSIGRLVPWKGFEILIEIIPNLLKKFPDLKLFIIGDGPDRELLKRKIRKLELFQNVFLLGKMPRKKLFQYLEKADLFVLNTGYEGFSHQILETLALGVPVVTTDVGGNPEIIKSGENGLLVPYNDTSALFEAINKMLSDADFARECSLSGKKTSETFTVNKMVNALVKEISQYA